jgi:predicted site-specific integrase-resolvase
MTRINRQKIHGSLNYTIKEMSEHLGVSEKTCHRWIESGLPIVTGGKKPILILGSEIKDFLRKKDSKKNIKLKRNEFYCLTCKGRC